MNATLRKLRVMLVPFGLTVLVGGALMAMLFGLTDRLPLSVALPFLAPDVAVKEVESQPTTVPHPINAAPPQLAATPTVPATEFTLVCEANARRYVLVHPDGKLVVTASRLLATPGDAYAYVIADGRLGRVELAGLDQESELLFMLQTEPLDRLASNVPLQELTDLAYDASSGALLLLDKSGRVFRYMPGGQWALVRQPEMAPDNQVDPGYLAISAAAGRVYLLDADLNQVWRFPGEGAQDGSPEPVFPGRGGNGAWGGPELVSGVDLSASREGLLALYADGSLRRYDEGDPHPTLDVPVSARLPLSLLAQGGRFYVVDGLRQALVAADATQRGPETGYRFVFPGMGLLRDAAIDEEGRVLALADNALIVYPPSEAHDTCDTPPDSPPPLFYYGVDLSSALADFRYPIDGAYLPPVPRAYPGARRLYRAGLHQGLDIHPWDVPGGIDIGEPIRAMQDGIVTRADVDYQLISNAEFNFLTEQALALGFSPPGTLDRISGRQVFIVHGNGISTHYLHLDSVADGIAPGAEVRRGEVIGTIGVSGTGREAEEVFVAAHAHVEIWVGDSYLGQGLSLRETMWLWQQVFPSVEVAPLVGE